MEGFQGFKRFKNPDCRRAVTSFALPKKQSSQISNTLQRFHLSLFTFHPTYRQGLRSCLSLTAYTYRNTDSGNPLLIV